MHCAPGSQLWELSPFLGVGCGYAAAVFESFLPLLISLDRFPISNSQRTHWFTKLDSALSWVPSLRGMKKSVCRGSQWKAVSHNINIMTVPCMHLSATSKHCPAWIEPPWTAWVGMTQTYLRNLPLEWNTQPLEWNTPTDTSNSQSPSRWIFGSYCSVALCRQLSQWGWDVDLRDERKLPAFHFTICALTFHDIGFFLVVF